MKAITIWQPWASLLACGAKQYETRGRKINYRGPIAIHAALKHPYHCIGGIIGKTTDAMLKALGAGDFRDLPLGCVIATAELAGCYAIVKPARIEGMISTGKMIKPDIPVSIYGNELLFGDWTPGRYALEFENMTLLPEPIPVKGMQGLWNWDEEGA